MLFVAWMVAGGCNGAPREDPSPRAIVREFVEDVRRHDVDGAMSHLADGFVFRDAGGKFAVGREAMPAMLSWDAAVRSRLRIDEVRASGDTVWTQLVEQNRLTDLLDLEPWVVEAVFVVRHAEITEEMVRELTAGEPTFTHRFQAALEPIRRWAAQERPALARTIFEDGQVARYDGPTARRLLELIGEYRRAGKPGG